MDQLKEHTTALKEHAANLVAKLRELEAIEQGNTDELAESELRAQVGEITEAEWEATSRKSQRERAKLKENQEVIADDLIKIRDILSDDDREGDDDEESPRTSADFDEMEFLKSVVGPNTPQATPTPVKRPPTPSGGTPRPQTPPGGTAYPPKREPTPAATPVQRLAEKLEVPAAAAPPAAPAAPAAKQQSLNTSSQSENALGIRSSDAVEQPKTLKCPECGTMNYSSEWYCERCGAELAAI